MKIKVLIILSFIIFGCNKKKETKEDVLDRYISGLNFFSDVNLETLFIVPVDVNCKACVIKLMDQFTKSKKKNVKLLLVGNDEIDEFVKLNNLKEDVYFIDDSNFLLKNDIMLINPIVVEKVNEKLDFKTIYPINADELLNEYFGELSNCQSIIENELTGLDFLGEIQSTSDVGDSLVVKLKSFKSEKISEVKMSKLGAELFKSKLIEGNLIKKDNGSPFFHEFVINKDDSATVTTHQFECLD